jgi:hypothetical protein
MEEPANAGAPATVAFNNALNEVVHGLDLSAEDWRQLGGPVPRSGRRVRVGHQPGLGFDRALDVPAA